MNNTHEELIAEKVAEITKEFVCIDGSCDNNGCIPYQVSEDEWEARQCEFCYKIRFPIIEQFTQTLQDTIDTVLEGERKRAALIVEEMMEDEEHWKPIANRILDNTPPNNV